MLLFSLLRTYMLKHLFSNRFLYFSQCFYLLWFSLLVKNFADRINVLRQFFFFFWCHLFVLITTPNFSVSSFVLTKMTCSQRDNLIHEGLLIEFAYFSPNPLFLLSCKLSTFFVLYKEFYYTKRCSSRRFDRRQLFLLKTIVYKK